MVTKNVGDPVTITSTIRNSGNANATFTIRATLNGLILGTKNQAISVGQTSQVSIQSIVTNAGTFDVTAEVSHGGTLLDTKTLPNEVIVQEVAVCPPPHEKFSVSGITNLDAMTDCWRTWDTGTQAFYPNEQVHARLGASGINQGDVITWELGWIDAQGGENMWPESTVSWTVPEQWEYVGAGAWWPEPEGTYVWTAWCPYIVKIFVNGQLLARLYFEVVASAGLSTTTQMAINGPKGRGGVKG